MLNMLTKISVLPSSTAIARAKRRTSAGHVRTESFPFDHVAIDHSQRLELGVFPLDRPIGRSCALTWPIDDLVYKFQLQLEICKDSRCSMIAR